MKPTRIVLRISLAICWICCLASGAFAEDDVITIGFVGDFSEMSRAYSENMFQAFQLALDDINAEGGLLGKTVRVMERDGGNVPQRHRDLVRRLIEEEKVVAVFGGASSPCVLEASAVCRDKQVPYLVSIGNSQSIVAAHGHPYVFLFEPSTWMETKGFGIFLTLMPWRRYAWIGPDYSWGHEILDGFKQHFDEIDAPIEWTVEAWHALGTTDFEDVLRQVRRSKPEAVVIGSWGEDARHLFLQANREGIFKDVALFGWFTYDTKEDMGRWLPEGAWILSRGPFNYLASKHERAKRLVDQLFERYHAYPNGFTICCYDSILAWRAAVLKAQSADPAAVAEALKGLEFESLRGSSRIRAIDGQMDCPTYFGRLGRVPEYTIPVWQSVIEVPAVKTWLDANDVRAARTKAAP